MYPFLLNMWVMGKVTEEELRDQKLRGRLTQQELDMILAKPKNAQ